jgi:hypothetical protein
MAVSEQQVRDALRHIQDPVAVHRQPTAGAWRHANARIAAAMRASLEQQRQPPPSPRA